MNRKMLVVDDDEVIVFALKDYFAKRGCDVDTARDHEQANALLTRQAYDLLIVDLHLGRTGLEGLDIIRALRACSASSRVILLTAFGTPEVVCRAMQYGADRVLHKPVALPEVEQQVRSLLEMTTPGFSAPMKGPVPSGSVSPLESEGAAMSRKKILIADDSQTVLLMERMILGKEPYDLILARDGQEAVDKAAGENPDLILLDVVMPKLTGFEALRRIREMDQTRSTPVIMVTTRAEAQNVETGYQTGCNDYVTKPINSHELLTKVKSYLGA